MMTMTNTIANGYKQFLTKESFFEYETIEGFEEIEGDIQEAKVFAVVDPENDYVSIDYVRENGFQFYYVTYLEEEGNALAHRMKILNSVEVICDYDTLFEKDNYVKLYPVNNIPFLKRKSKLESMFK